MAKPHALVIEDDTRLASIFSEALKKVGFTVQVANKGSVASQAISESSPVLVLLDLHLPEVDGEALLEQIRASDHIKNAKVILATADVNKANKLQDLADMILIKPIGFFHLQEVAKSILDQL